MAAAFYSRYVPPSAASQETRASELGVPQKRKRETEAEPEIHVDHHVPTSPPHSTNSAKSEVGRKKSKKRKDKSSHAVQTDRSSGAAQSYQAAFSSQHTAQTNGQVVEEKTSGRDASTENKAHRAVETGRSTGSTADTIKSDKKDRRHRDTNDESMDDRRGGEKKKKEKKMMKKKKEKQDNVMDAESSTPNKHTKIMSKFERSQSEATKLAEATGGEDQQTTEELNDNNDIAAHGLEPLPQPEPTLQQTELPSYATLPSWLAEPYSVPSDLRRDFKSIGVDNKLVSTLQSRGYTEAFPIQSAVSTLLSRGPDYHDGDICISAATGSGKTLAYTLPLVAGIEYSPVSRLRGLIVVPTRELVKQARESCELCARGSGLRIGTAVGSTALKEEQQQLMGRSQVYDPVAYRSRNEIPMTANDWASFNLLDYLDIADDSQDSLPDHVPISSPNIDILICTPGRLVDHIRSTKGFALEHVQWLVIDEADRLLNESFQEWVETVIPAFESSQKTANGNTAQSFLSQLGRSIDRPKLRKIILSATMTRDITKLNSLRLQNPKLVVMDDRNNANKSKNTEREDDIIHFDPQGNARLPDTLSEFYVPVGDGSEKPLFLLQLLRRHLNFGKESVPRSSASASSTSSSSSSEDTSDDDDSASSTSSASPNTSSSPPNSNTSGQPTALIFTKSSESAARLSRLLTLLQPSLSDRIGTLTKSTKSSSSRRTLSAYRQGKLSIIVATDRASRGLDLPSLSHVISYDVPASVTSYIHRVGRTARAGREGSAWTLVAHREGRWFSNEIVKGPVERVAGEKHAMKKIHLQLDDDSALRQRYVDAQGELERQIVDSTRPANRPDKQGRVPQ